MSESAVSLDARPMSPANAPAYSEDWVVEVATTSPAHASGVQLTSRGPLRVFVDGVLFDRDDLARSTGLDAGTASAADLVAAMYERRGEEALDRLRGSFVAFLVDTRRDRVIIARDPLGSHPLVYTQAAGRLRFASLPHTLLSQEGVSPALNAEAMADHLCGRWPDRGEMFFKDVRRVPPGWRAEIRGGVFRVEPHWSFIPPGAGFDWLPTEEAERFDEVLHRAVKRSLSMGDAGVFLSGGIDSISVAATAVDICQQSGRRLPLALSLAFPHPSCDERLVQTTTAKQLGVTQTLVDFDESVGPAGLFRGALDLTRHFSQPLYNVWAPAYLPLARRARSLGVSTIMTGNGGDEGLGVSPFLAADYMRKGDLLGLARLARAWHKSYALSVPQIVQGVVWTFGLRPLASQMLHRSLGGMWDRQREARYHSRDEAWVAPDAALRRELRRRTAGSLAPADPKHGFYAREAIMSIDNTLNAWDLEEQFQFTRSTGVRYSHPYYDPDLLKHLLLTPPEVLSKGGRSKGVVREGLARRFPGLGLERQRKVSAVSFYKELMQREGPPLAREVENLRTLGSLGVVDGNDAWAFVTDAFARGTDKMHSAWRLINMETWARAQVN